MHGDFSFWSFVTDAFVIFLFIMWIWLLITVFGDLFRRKDVGGLTKVVWVIFLLFLPYIGVFAYLLTQGNSMADRNTQAAEAARDHLRHVVGFSVADEINKLESLKADGKITAEEYTKMRSRLV